jgi:hypothetical protein
MASMADVDGSAAAVCSASTPVVKARIAQRIGPAVSSTARSGWQDGGPGMAGQVPKGARQGRSGGARDIPA